MGTVAVASSSQAFRRVPTGVHVARCISVIDLGTQRTEWQGEINYKHKIQIQWEVLGEDEYGVPLTVETDQGERPLTISKRYTLSMSDKSKLKPDLEAWRGKPFSAEEGKGFDVKNLLGAYCMLNVVEQEGQNGKTYSNIAAITPLPRELAKHKPAGVHPLVHFDVDNPDMALFASFHDKLRETIQASAEWQARSKPAPAAPAAKAPGAQVPFDDMDDDPPF